MNLRPTRTPGVPSRHGTVGHVLARYVSVPLLAFLALAAWALASPVGATPDEDYHLSSIWCGQGIEAGVCEASPDAGERRVSETLPSAPGCYAFKPDVSAACQDSWFAPESDTLVSTARGNFTGDYPPVFYYAMNTFVGDDISRSVVLMRLANAALFVGLITALFWLLPRVRRAMLLMGTALALVPLGVFVVPSINPSGWAVLSSALVFPALVGFFETAGRRRAALAGIAAVGTCLGAGARADAAIYAVLAIALAVLLTVRRHQHSPGLLALPAVLTAVCAVSYLSSGQAQAVSVGLDGSEGPARELADAIAYNLLNVPELWAGALGSWGLGWLDTRMPSLVWVVNLVTFGAVLYLGARRTSPRKAVALGLAVLAAWVIPVVVLVQSSALVGSEVQPRYLLPLLVLVGQVALFRLDSRAPQLSRGQLALVVASLTLTNAVALHTNIRRYVTGSDLIAFDLDAGREWWWGFPPGPMNLWLVGSLTFGAALLLIARTLRSYEQPAVTTAPEPVEPVEPVERYQAA